MRNLLRARDMHTSFSLVNVVKLNGHRAQWRLATVEETRRQFCARARVPPLSDRADLVAPGIASGCQTCAGRHIYFK